MTIAYIDESGNLADGKLFFITVVVCVESDKVPEILFRKVRKVLNKKKLKEGKEIKFSGSSDRLKNYFVKRISNEKIYCFTFVIEKDMKNIKDSPENYGKVLSWVMREGFSLYHWNRVIIDRKFDKERDQKLLLSKLRNFGLDLKKINFVDSKKSDGIKLADFIAGFYGQFYNSNKPLPKPISVIVKEERLAWSLLKQKVAEPKGSDAPI